MIRVETDARCRLARGHGHVESGCRFQRVDDVPIMCPAFREIFERMGGRISAEKIRLPVRRRAKRVIRLQRRRIIRSLVTKHVSESRQHRGVQRHQPVPEIMPALMAEMAQQGAIGFPHCFAHLFAHGVIGFRQGERDDPVIVSRHDMRGGRVGEKVEGQPMGRIVVPGGKWKPQKDQVVKEPVLGIFDPGPEQRIAGHGQIRNDAGVSAVSTVAARIAAREHPVADAITGIVAKFVGALRHRQDLPAAAGSRFERGERAQIGQIAQRAIAMLAARILEIEKLAAGLACK